MADVPEAITNRIAEIESKISEIRTENEFAVERIKGMRAEVKAFEREIITRKRDIQFLKTRRSALRFAVAAIEGRIVDIGAVDFVDAVEIREADIVDPPAAPEVVELAGEERTEPPVEDAGAAASSEQKTEPANDINDETLRDNSVPLRDRILGAVRMLEHAKADKIANVLGTDTRALGAVLGRLSREKLITCNNDREWTATAP